MALCLANARDVTSQSQSVSPRFDVTQLAQVNAIPAPSAQAKAEDKARESFDSFTQEWMKKLIGTEGWQKKNKMEVTHTADGFVAEYNGYLPHRYTVVKPTESKAIPFIGVLTYYKKVMRSVAKTKEEAVQGSFEQAGTTEVSEIFRYTKGKWVY